MAMMNSPMWVFIIIVSCLSLKDNKNSQEIASAFHALRGSGFFSHSRAFFITLSNSCAAMGL